MTMAGIASSGVGLWPMPGVHQVADPSSAFSRGVCQATQTAVFQPFNQYDWTYNFGGSKDSHLIHLPSQYDGEGSSLPGLVSVSDTFDSYSGGC